MKKKIFLIGLLVFAVVLSGCIEPEPTGPDGESFAAAIVIQADNEDDGVAMEYNWLYDNGCEGKGGVVEMEMQELQEQDEQLFDLLHTSCANGETVIYYFNIDSFFGKW